MVKSVIVHIGMHKTGSSSIQAALQGYDDGRIFYSRLAGRNNGVAIYTAFSGDYMNYDVWMGQGLAPDQITARRRHYNLVLRQELERADRETLVISGEDISILPLEAKDAFLETLHPALRDITVLCYLRDPGSFAASMFQQSVKAGAVKLLREDVSPRYRFLLKRFVDVLGLERVKVFDFGTIGNVCDHFLGVNGLKPPQNATGEYQNQSMTLPALKLVRLFNMTNPCFVGEKKLLAAYTKLYKSLVDAYSGAAKISPGLFSPLADYSDTGYLAENFDIRFSPGKDLSDRTVEDLENVLNDLSDVDLVPLMQLLEKSGVRTNMSDPVKMVNRLYYCFIAEGNGQ